MVVVRWLKFEEREKRVVIDIIAWIVTQANTRRGLDHGIILETKKKPNVTGVTRKLYATDLKFGLIKIIFVLTSVMDYGKLSI